MVRCCPRFGERWGRHWLDVARYSDTNGYEKDLQREQWAWRDWVITAMNADMPYDQFLIEQIAGDMLPSTDGAAVNTANVDLAHAAGLEFHVWTINSTGRMQQLIDLGVDGITTDDPAALRELVPFSPADFNSNGVVDADDLALWKTGFGTSTGTTRADGDADNDGDVDGGDYLVWQQQFTAGTASTSAAATVPEPSAALLAGLALAAATTIRGHRRAAAKSKRAISGV